MIRRQSMDMTCSIRAQAGSDPPKSGKSLWGRKDDSYFTTAKDMLKVQAGAQFDSFCSLLERKLIFNWGSLNFASFISLAKPVEKISVSANDFQTDPFMQSLHVPWAAQNIPQASIISVRKLSSYDISCSRMKVGLQKNQHSPLAHLSSVTFAHR